MAAPGPGQLGANVVWTRGSEYRPQLPRKYPAFQKLCSRNIIINILSWVVVLNTTTKLAGWAKKVSLVIFAITLSTASRYVTTMTSYTVAWRYGHVTIRLSIDDFLYVLNRNQTRCFLSSRDI